MVDRKKSKIKKKILDYDEMTYYTDDTPSQELIIMHEEKNESFEETGGFVNIIPRDEKAADITLGLRNMGLR